MPDTFNLVDDGDQLLECRDCGREFLLSRAEREFFTARELHIPKRCKACRNLRKGQAAMIHARDSTREGAR